MDAREELILGALLHDIGKFGQRAEVETENFDFEGQRDFLCPENQYKKPSHLHVAWTAYFIDKILKNLPEGLSRDNIYKIACKHHKPDKEDPLQS